MKLKKLFSVYRFVVAICLIVIVVSFWLGSRFTVDDAFITWRYGKNLIQSGIWGYNPSVFDLTQAYTNPIYAFLSIVPPLFKVDVVLFFKLFSTITLIGFSYWFLKITKNSLIMLLLLVGLPATVIHIYSGLETFLFVFLFSVLLVSLYKNEKKISYLVAILLFLTRPESWLLVILIPAYYSVRSSRLKSECNRQSIWDWFKTIQINLKELCYWIATLAIPLVVYFAFHYLYFGSALPNTFYAKSGSSFAPKEFIKYLFFISPIFLLILVNKYKIFLFSIIFLLMVAYKYSTSYLVMDYSGRFAFHIFIPVYCLIIYVGTDLKSKKVSLNIDKEQLINASLEVVIKYILTAYVAVFLLTSGVRPISLFNAYPRALDAHAAFGKLLLEQSAKNNHVLVMGDAGIAPYHFNFMTLDSAGLASSEIVHKGVSAELLDKYGVDIIAFYAQPQSIQWSLYSQQIIYDWAIKNNFQFICDLYWTPEYLFKIYAKYKIQGLNTLCQESKNLNNVSEKIYFKNNYLIPPWRYWKQ